MDGRNTKQHTMGDTGVNECVKSHMEQMSHKKMRYHPGKNNTETGKNRMDFTMSAILRFGSAIPSILAHIYDIEYRQAREHLQKLEKKGLVAKLHTFRSADNMVYVPTFEGAKYVEQRLNIPVHFRRSKTAKLCNVNNLMHDVMNQFVLLKLLNEESVTNPGYYAFSGLLTEPETKRLLSKFNFKICDGSVMAYSQRNDTFEHFAIEFEHGHKSPTNRGDSILGYKRLLRANVYKKVLFFSHDEDKLKDAQRMNDKFIAEMTGARKKGGDVILTGEDAEMLERCIEYRGDYCDELMAIFYR